MHACEKILLQITEETIFGTTAEENKKVTPKQYLPLIFFGLDHYEKFSSKLGSSQVSPNTHMTVFTSLSSLFLQWL